MPNLASIYGKRFQNYFIELQRYMQFIISGHIAVVLLFVIGAAGYSYSQWLQAPAEDFPAFLVSAVVLTLIVVPNRPALLLKQADHYFFLPMEQQMRTYLRPALRWSELIVIVRSLVVMVITIPLLTRVGELSSSILIGLALLVIVLAIWNVRSKFYAFWAHNQMGGLDFLIRIGVVFGTFYFFLSSNWFIAGLFGVVAVIYYIVMLNKSHVPFPFDRMIDMEQQRMQRFYQFANYFTEVPHVRSKVSRRAWLDGLLSKENMHEFLIARSFVRKDELFYMWLRLAVLLALVPFLSFTYVVAGLLVVFSFAIAIQTHQGLLFNQIFRMDMLYPQPEVSKQQVVMKFARMVSYAPLVLGAVVACLFHEPVLILVAIVAAVVSIEWYFVRKKKQPD